MNNFSSFVVCKGKNSIRCGKIAQDSQIKLEDQTQQEMAENDATCLSGNQICDGCYDCQLGIDESNEFCDGRYRIYYLLLNYSSENHNIYPDTLSLNLK